MTTRIVELAGGLRATLVHQPQASARAGASMPPRWLDTAPFSLTLPPITCPTASRGCGICCRRRCFHAMTYSAKWRSLMRKTGSFSNMMPPGARRRRACGFSPFSGGQQGFSGAGHAIAASRVARLSSPLLCGRTPAFVAARAANAGCAGRACPYVCVRFCVRRHA